MKQVRIALLQGNFRSSFAETIPEIAQIAQFKEQMGPEDFRYNQDLLISLTRQAAASGAELVVSPESYLDGWSFRREVCCKVATTIPGPETEELSALASELKVWMCVGLFEKAQGRLFNSAVLLASDGKIAGVYRKTHETKDVLGQLPYDLGEELPVFQTPWGTIGILICHDRWYPENARTLRCKGAEVILNPVATGVLSPNHKYYEIHQCVIRSQAYLNALFWVSCNCANHGGHSLVVAPDGSLAVQASAEQQVLLAELDSEANSYDFVCNLRRGLYDLPF